MISAYPGLEKEAHDAGADDYLAKPFDVEDLLAKVEKCIFPGKA